jgi:hypothetical protein
MALLDDRPRECRTAAPLEAAIADGSACGAFPATDPHRDALLVESLCSSLDRGTVDWLGADRDEGVERVASFVLAALGNPQRADGQPSRPQSTPSTTRPVIRSSS